jgi:hypothetical protein
MAPRRRRRQPFALGYQGLNTSGPGYKPLKSGGLGNSNGSTTGAFNVEEDDKDGPFDELVGAGKVVLDLLSAPSRAIGGTIIEAQEDGFQPTDLIKGIGRSFDEDADPSDALGIDNFWGALAADIVIDPLSLLAAPKIATTAIKGGKAATAALEAGEGVSSAVKAGKEASKAARQEGILGKLRGEAQAKKDSYTSQLESAAAERADLVDGARNIPKTKKQQRKARRKEASARENARRVRQEEQALRRDIRSQEAYREKGTELEDGIAQTNQKIEQENINALAAGERELEAAEAIGRPGGRTYDDLVEEENLLLGSLEEVEATRKAVASTGSQLKNRQTKLDEVEEAVPSLEAETAAKAVAASKTAEEALSETTTKLDDLGKEVADIDKAIARAENARSSYPRGSGARRGEQLKLNKLREKKREVQAAQKASRADRKKFEALQKKSDEVFETAKPATSGRPEDVLGFMALVEKTPVDKAASVRDLDKSRRTLNKSRSARDELRDKVSPEKVAQFSKATKEAYELKQRLREIGRLKKQASNPKTLERRGAKKAGLAEQLGPIKAAFGLGQADNVSDVLSKFEDTPIDETLSLAGATNQVRQSSRTLQRQQAELDEVQGKILSPEELAAVTDKADRLAIEAADSARRAQEIGRSLEQNILIYSNRVDELNKTIATNEKEIGKLDRILDSINSDEVLDWTALDADIARLHDFPAMRDLAPDMVQRRLMVAPFGIQIPLISDALSVPLGRAYSKSARRSAFAKKHPTLSKLRDTVGKTFDPIYGIAPLVADLERGRSNLAKATADKLIAQSQRYWSKIDKPTRSQISRLAVHADDMGVDLATEASRQAAREGKELAKAEELLKKAEAESELNPLELAQAKVDEARKSKVSGSVGKARKEVRVATKYKKNLAKAQELYDEALKVQKIRISILDEFDELPDIARESMEFTLQTYRKDAKVDMSLGLFENFNDSYSSRLRPISSKDDVFGDPLIMRVNDSKQLLQDQGFTQARKSGTPDEEIDFFQAFALRQIQAAQMRQGYGMINSLNAEVGRVFKKGEVEEGFVRPTGKAADWVGEDVYFPEEIVESLDRINEIWSTPRVLNEFTRKWSILNGQFKNLAYSVNPGHLAIDAIGDTWNMWLAKVPIFDPRYAPRAIAIAKEIEVYERAIGKGLVPAKTTVKLADGKDYEISDLLLTLDAKGLRNRGRSTGRTSGLDNEGGDYLAGEPGKYDPRRAARSGTDQMQRVGNLRDNTARSFGMIAQLQKNIDDGMEYSMALNAAGNTIRFSTFDYNDLTPIEKRLFRNLIPFYTWSRKNIPYQLNRLMEVPGRVVLPLNVQEATFEREGAPDLSLMQPFSRETNFLLPDQVASLIPGMDGAAVYMNPMLPSMDLGRFQTFRIDGEEGPIPGFDAAEPIGMLSPYLKAPFEIAMGREFFSGREIGSNPAYLMRTFFGQPGSQVVRQLAPNTAGYEESAPFGLTKNQFLGVTGQFIGFRGTTIEEGPASAARLARLQAIQLRKAEREEARREAGNLVTLPLLGFDIRNPFHY